MAFTLVLPNGSQTTGFSISHLAAIFYGAGDNVANGVQVASLSWLSNPGTTYQNSSCTTLNSTAPHVHVESARTGTTWNNDVDPISGPWWQPYWYYQY